MDDIVLTRTLVGQGFDDRDLGRMRRDGSLLRYAVGLTYGRDLRNVVAPKSIES